jgi:hypothetical protein
MNSNEPVARSAHAIDQTIVTSNQAAAALVFTEPEIRGAGHIRTRGGS